MANHFKQVAIVGVGLIGGSLGMLLKKSGMAEEVIGIGRTVQNLETAVRVGAIDRFVSDSLAGVEQADLVILATPVDSYISQLKVWGDRLRPGTIVSDVGSVKGALVERLEQFMPDGIYFIGAHPIAGKEKTGAIAGSLDLFQGAKCIVTPTKRSHPPALERIKEVWEMTGAEVLVMDPYVHDQVLGAVSHLPHIVAYALMTALGEIGAKIGSSPDVFDYAGGGLRDTTRIAASSPEMWRDICMLNKTNLVELIEVYEHHLAQFKRLIQGQETEGLKKEIELAKQLRHRLD